MAIPVVDFDAPSCTVTGLESMRKREKKKTATVRSQDVALYSVWSPHRLSSLLLLLFLLFFFFFLFFFFLFLLLLFFFFLLCSFFSSSSYSLSSTSSFSSSFSSCSSILFPILSFRNQVKSTRNFPFPNCAFPLRSKLDLG